MYLNKLDTGSGLHYLEGKSKEIIVKFVDVIIPLAVEGVFTYVVPEILEEKIREGVLVIVPFVGNKKYTGLVCRVHSEKPLGYEAKVLEDLAEENISFSALHLRFLEWVAAYYMALPGDVLRAALPIIFRLESFTDITLTEEDIDFTDLTENEQAFVRFLRKGEYTALREAEKYLKIRNGWRLVKSLLNKGYLQVRETIDEAFKEKTEKWIKWARNFNEAELNRVLDRLKRAPVQYQMLCKWIETGEEEMEKHRFLTEGGGSAAILKALCDKNILAQEERVVSRLDVVPVQEQVCHALSVNQQQAFQQIQYHFRVKECVLLQGVTSSGKTEIYIHLIRDYIARGKQVLYMLPEIALTVQIIKRLRRVFGDTIGIYHSGMPDQVRAELWKKQCSTDPYPVVLGVRSSVFLPFQKLGLIIVDEEHDSSYKQKEPSPRYQGRDAAIMLAKMHRAKVLLGSATPSFETYYNIKNGKYGYVTLTSRYGDILMPEIQFADVAEYRRKKQMKGSFSPLLYWEMKQVLKEGKQVILFQNRRGYSAYMQCDACGATLKCDHCDVSMTYYKQRDILSCRYCGSIKKPEELCGECGKGHYRLRTPGTEKIEEEVVRLFPGVQVARMDMEAMNSRAKYQSVIDDFEQGKTQVLVGTQMVSKGLDFENVKLVGVMDADSMVNFPDFRAEERAYEMLMQVSGRSGRKGQRGLVVIQTADLQNRIYKLLFRQDYATFYAELAEERQNFAYPPFCRLISVEIRHKEVVALRSMANQLASRLREQLGKRVCGPAVPEVGRIGGMYRLQIIIKIEQGASFSKVKAFLKQELAGWQKGKGFSGFRMICDVDPG